MSSVVPSFLQESDPKIVELVRKLRLKTSEEKIRWTKEKNAYVTKTAGGQITAAFTESATSWGTFRIVVETSEVLNAVNAEGMLALLAGSNALYKEIGELYRIVSGGSTVDRALNYLDKI